MAIKYQGQQAPQLHTPPQAALYLPEMQCLVYNPEVDHSDTTYIVFKAL